MSNAEKIVLKVEGMGDPPSFKNRKRAIWDERLKQMRTLTEPKTKQWMERCIQNFVSQLRSVTRMGGGAILMGQQQRSSIVSSLPLDDSWAWIPEIHLYGVPVDKGHEGTEIVIERIESL